MSDARSNRVKPDAHTVEVKTYSGHDHDSTGLGGSGSGSRRQDRPAPPLSAVYRQADGTPVTIVDKVPAGQSVELVAEDGSRWKSTGKLGEVEPA